MAERWPRRAQLVALDRAASGRSRWREDNFATAVSNMDDPTYYRTTDRRDCTVRRWWGHSTDDGMWLLEILSFTSRALCEQRWLAARSSGREGLRVQGVHRLLYSVRYSLHGIYR